VIVPELSRSQRPVSAASVCSVPKHTVGKCMLIYPTLKDSKCILSSETCKRVSHIPFAYDTQILKWVCACAHAQWLQRGMVLYYSTLHSPETGSTLNPELGWQLASSSDLPVSLLTALGLQGQTLLLRWVLDVQIWVLMLSQKSFLPTAYFPASMQQGSTIILSCRPELQTMEIHD